MSLTLDAVGVAELLGWTRRDGQPDYERVRKLYRAGRFPAPIDPTESVRYWCWSRRRVEAYADGGFTVVDGSPQPVDGGRLSGEGSSPPSPLPARRRGVA